MGFKDRFNKIFGMPNNYEEVSLQIPEEKELNSYLEEERRDEIRKLCYQKRRERLNKMLGMSRYGAQEDLAKLKTKESFNFKPRKTPPLGGRESYLKPYRFNAR